MTADRCGSTSLKRSMVRLHRLDSLQYLKRMFIGQMVHEPFSVSVNGYNRYITVINYKP